MSEIVAVDQIRKVGRPLKFQSVEQLNKRIEAYFKQADWPTITGLAVWLDTSRKVLLEYSFKPEYSNSIKMALDKCENAVEQGVLMGKLNPVMGIFTLKNNYGWVDRTEAANINVEVSTSATQSATSTAAGFADYLQQATQAQPEPPQALPEAVQADTEPIHKPK